MLLSLERLFWVQFQTFPDHADSSAWVLELNDCMCGQQPCQTQVCLKYIRMTSCVRLAWRGRFYASAVITTVGTTDQQSIPQQVLWRVPFEQQLRGDPEQVNDSISTHSMILLKINACLPDSLPDLVLTEYFPKRAFVPLLQPFCLLMH